jgi:hypothetical protein
MESIDLLVERIVRRLAYNLWRKRGCPIGSPEIDWEKAEEILAHAFLVNWSIEHSPVLIEELNNCWREDGNISTGKTKNSK